ncbi:hypothetical protein LOTGIDRAFT_233356 [Lottia gigantea]|uniref:SURP motif domain-containing protein n=1 Tax=Lottia gigantea TaxID=225164 RepID=V4AEL1_LOTGI|nr:hypothetical protein LOTGIDRAFT_233356 [Lottia gigantea]ESO91786.1 hypothetical protein LOTGIDRAFT_233356 [Lottia gigantea]
MAAQLWLEDENSCQSQKDDDQDLFVFGYACKIFRNDEKALYVDKGRHLIPWMGDDSLMIDRYDGRGHLYDLSQCEADVEKKELSEEEEKLEKLCDEERYLELNTDIAEKTVYEEEEWKRYQEALQSGYNAVGFSYEQPESSQDIYHQDEQHSEDEKPFIPPSCLNIPSDLIVPTTNKINAVIEKTAKFIAEHGTQMEIVLKAKQALNSQFDFLDYNSSLNSYYKLVVKAIKSGKYIPRTQPNDIKNHESQEDNEQHDHHEHGYLHKSLASKVQPCKSVKMPVVSINDTPYGQLVKSIRKHHKEENIPEPSADLQALTPSYALHPQQHEREYHQEDEQFYNQQLMVTVKGDNHSYHASSLISKPPSVEIHQLQHTENDSSVSNQPNPIIPPPPDIQPIIDRMAMYVAKNGSEFEMVVQSKNDVRFQFLNDWHVHYKYYDFKKKMHQQILLKEKKEKEEAQVALLNKSVSFSIKTRNKESEPVTQLKKPLFDYGSSDDNNDSDSEKEKSSSSTPSSDHTSNRLEESNICQNELFQDENKKAVEGRLMNKLAGAAREKLAQTSKEKQIQAERKRKAAMFISLLKGKSEQKNDIGNQEPKIVIDYGHGQKDDKESPNHRATSKSITPPLSFNVSRRSKSRSPSRKSFHSKNPGSRYRSPPSANHKSRRVSPSRRSRTPRISPNRRRSRTPRISPNRRSRTPKNSRSSRSKTPRISPDRKRRKARISPSSLKRTSRNSLTRSRSPVKHGSKSASSLTEAMENRSTNDRSSRSNDYKSSRSREDKPSRSKGDRTSQSVNDKSLNHQMEKKKSPLRNSDYDSQADLIELTHLTNIVIKKEKSDPGFDKAQSNSGSLVPTENSKCSENRTSETNENNSVTSDKQEDDYDDDDVKIVEVPVEPVETVELVDLTYLSSDSDIDKKRKTSEKHDRKKRKSRSPSKSRKKRRRSRSKSTRRRTSPYRRRRSRSKSSTKGRHHSSSNSLQGKHSKRHRSKSRSRSHKRKKDKSCSPKSRKSKSKSLDRKISRRDRSKSRSNIRKRSRSKTPIRKTIKSPSQSANRKRSHSRSVSPRRRGSKAKKKHKSPSRSPKSHKRKKTKEKEKSKEKMFEATMIEVRSSDMGSSKMMSDPVPSNRSQLKDFYVYAKCGRILLSHPSVLPHYLYAR